MKRTIPLSIQHFFVALFCLILSSSYSQEKGKTAKANPKNGYVRCTTTEHEKFLQAKYSKRITESQFESWVTPLIKRYSAMRSTSQSGGIITIPVVVHIIHSGQANGVAPNITDTQVESQIKVINEDYRKMLGTPGYNTNPVGADTQIQFALAQQTPNGNPTNGIDRVSFCQTGWNHDEIESTLKPATIWDTTLYLNMWSVEFTDKTLLGYAQFPDPSGLNGLESPPTGSQTNDGVVANYSTFGSDDYNDGTFLLNAPYNKGRTMTHELGHWLGLRHIWGDSNCGTDYCDDTPTHHDANYECPLSIVNCDNTGNEMVQNYMDYTDDSCMNIFTQNQKDRMVIIMNNAARRSTLKNSTKNSPITLFANDAEVKLEASCPTTICGGTPNQTTQKVTIYNRGTSNLTAATLNYTINGGSNNVYNWVGNLTTNKYATFDLIINSTSNGSITVTVAKANGVTDQRSTNNTVSGTFIIPTNPSNFTFLNYVFSLQQDLWGSETTWNLKNTSGTILYSGGPYTDTTTGILPELITQNWTLTGNQCYTFTINDSAGDGICCGSENGDGYYDIKSTDGITVVTSGASFSSSESKSFSTYSLGNSEFKKSNDIYLYPNPTKGILNIRIPNDFGLPNNFTISNSLGQIISKKKISTENDLTVNTLSLSHGVYFITIVKDNEKKTMQFIKQ
jgi:hypothetical protein